MDKKDCYTLKEIILGLHNEYLIHQQNLQELKQFCEIDEKKAIDFEFRIFQPEQKNPILLCEYSPKQNKVQKFITDFSKKTGYYIYGRHTARLVTDNNQYYFLCGRLEYPVHVKYNYGMEEEFSKYVNSILKSEFSNNIKSQYIEDNYSDINAALTINSTMIGLYVRDNCRIPYSTILYDSREDVLKFISFEEQLNKQYMETALDIAFPSEKLNEYHINTILNNKDSKKSMIIEEFNSCNTADFDIQSKETQYVLQKVKK